MSLYGTQRRSVKNTNHSKQHCATTILHCAILSFFSGVSRDEFDKVMQHSEIPPNERYIVQAVTESYKIAYHQHFHCLVTSGFS